MAGEARETGSGLGLTLGGGIGIAGIVIAIFWSVVIGVIVALVGLVAFGGFARGRWYSEAPTAWGRGASSGARGQAPAL